jgi:predicted RNA-binding protein
VTKGSVSGRFYYDLLSRERPEVYRHAVRLRDRYTPPQADLFVLALETDVKPFSRFGWIAELSKALAASPETRSRVHVAVLSSAYGVVPLELDSIYPLSQYESSIDLEDPSTARTLASDAAWYVAGMGSYKAVLVIYERGRNVAESVAEKLRRLGYRVYMRRFTSVEDAISFAKLIFQLISTAT